MHSFIFVGFSSLFPCFRTTRQDLELGVGRMAMGRESGNEHPARLLNKGGEEERKKRKKRELRERQQVVMPRGIQMERGRCVAHMQRLA